MPEQPPIPQIDLPTGLPDYAWFDGILEGAPRDKDALRLAVGELNRQQLVNADLEVDGGRYTVLLADAPVDGHRMDPAAQAQLLDGIQRIADASDRRQIESTLRCSMVFADRVVETLFASMRGEIKTVSRVRPIDQDDQAHRPVRLGSLPDANALTGLGRRRALLVAAGLLLMFVTYGLYDGLFARLAGTVFGPGGEQIAVDTGPFGETLEVTVESSFGSYAIELRRGRGYPETAEQIDALEAAANTAVDRAAVHAVSNGDRIWVQLRDQDGAVLEAVAIDLRALLGNVEAVERAPLPGRLTARTVALALDDGRRR